MVGRPARLSLLLIDGLAARRGGLVTSQLMTVACGFLDCTRLHNLNADAEADLSRKGQIRLR